MGAPARGEAAISDVGAAVNQIAGAVSSVPIPKFVSLCGTPICELRNRRTLATYWS